MSIIQVLPASCAESMRAINPYIDSEKSIAGDCVEITSYTGRVVAVNDFFAIVLSSENKPLHIHYSPASYPIQDNFAAVDASQEVIDAYTAYMDKTNREARVMGLLKLRNTRKEERKKTHLTYTEQKRLRMLYTEGGETYRAILILLQTRRFRSQFRQKMTSIIRNWLADPTPKFRHPLSSRQLQYII